MAVIMCGGTKRKRDSAVLAYFEALSIHFTGMNNDNCIKSG
jgi:hypothetical protein